jgi:hypothetical protein
MGFHTIGARGKQEEISGFFNFFSKIGYDDFLPVHHYYRHSGSLPFAQKKMNQNEPE